MPGSRSAVPTLPVGHVDPAILDAPPTPAERQLAEAFDRDVAARLAATLAEAAAREAARELVRARAEVQRAAAEVRQLARVVDSVTP